MFTAATRRGVARPRDRRDGRRPRGLPVPRDLQPAARRRSARCWSSRWRSASSPVYDDEAARRGPGARADDAAGGDDRVARSRRRRAGPRSGRWCRRSTRTGCASAWGMQCDPTVIYALQRAGPLERQPDPRRTCSSIRPTTRIATAACRPDRSPRRGAPRSRPRRAGRRRRISTSSAATTGHTSSRRRSTSTTATCTSTRCSTSGISAARWQK